MNPSPTAPDEVRPRRAGDEDDASGPTPVTPPSSKPAASKPVLSTPSTVPPGYYLG